MSDAEQVWYVAMIRLSRFGLVITSPPTKTAPPHATIANHLPGKSPNSNAAPADREQNHGRAKILATHNQQQCKTKPRNQLEICLIWSDFVYLLLRVDQFPRQPYAQRKLNDFGGLEGKSKRPIQPLLPWTSIPKGVNVSDCKSKAIIRKTKLNFLMSSAGIIMQATPTISPRTQNPPVSVLGTTETVRWQSCLPKSWKTP